jgi:ACS family glucarate transporter-like MFS transporter
MNTRKTDSLPAAKSAEVPLPFGAAGSGLYASRPSRTRWIIVSLLLVVTTYAFVTRLSMSYAARGIQNEFHLTNVQTGWVLSAFVIGYGLCQVPVGLMIDRFGPRSMLAIALLAWSCCTLLTSFASAFALLVGIRVATGMAQSAVLPSGNKIVSRWMPASERARGNSIFFTGIGLGGIIAPPMTVGLMLRYGWRVPLELLGLAGILLAGLWIWYATDTPRQHASVNRGELELIESGQEQPESAVDPAWHWGPVLRNRSIWALVLSYSVAGYPSYVFYTWFYLYIADVRHVNAAASGYWSMTPYLAMAIMSPVGGRTSDWLASRYEKRIGRAAVGLSGELLAAVLIVAGARVEDARLAMMLLALAAGFHVFGQTAAWAATIDLTLSHPATLFGLMNTGAQAAGAVAPVLTPFLAKTLGWAHALDFAAGMLLLAGVLWLGIRADRPVAG